MRPMPPKIDSPSETLTPDLTSGLEAPETTRPLPPEEGVLKAKVLSPTVREYQVFLLQEAE